MRKVRRLIASRRARPAAVLALLSTVALLAGCGGGGGHKAATAKRPARTPAGSSHLMQFKLADDSTGPVTAQVPRQPIGTTPASINGVTLELYLAKRVQPGAVLVVFALKFGPSASTSGSTADAMTEGLSADSGSPSSIDNPSVSGVSLFDPTGLKEYQTFMSNPAVDLTCLCSQIQPGVPYSAPSTSYFAALVAAPPASVTSVSFVTGLGTIADVPLS
jgi:hypothetical protein